MRHRNICARRIQACDQTCRSDFGQNWRFLSVCLNEACNGRPSQDSGQAFDILKVTHSLNVLKEEKEHKQPAAHRSRAMVLLPSVRISVSRIVTQSLVHTPQQKAGNIESEHVSRYVSRYVSTNSVLSMQRCASAVDHAAEEVREEEISEGQGRKCTLISCLPSEEFH